MMCAVSMIGDHYRDKWQDRNWYQGLYGPAQWPGSGPNQTVVVSNISRQEFDDLKKEVEELKALLIRAKEYDERNNEPHCEMEDKVALLRKVAEMVGVDLNDVLGKPA